MLYHNNMIRVLLLIFIAFLWCSSVYAAEIVYPKNCKTEINSPVTFFIGNEKKCSNLKINGNLVKVHSSGGFKHSVDLNYGQNEFIIQSDCDKKVYKIFRPYPKKEEPATAKFINYNTSKIGVTKQNNIPLRSTPSTESSYNRLEHLQAGIVLNIAGEYKDFYKVKLARDDFGWILKDYVEIPDLNSNDTQALITEQKFSDSENLLTYKFKTTQKIPYILSETNHGFDLTIYELNPETYPLGKYEMSIPLSGKKFGYKSYYNSGNELVIEIKKPKAALKDLTVTIDAGHGGSEYGAIGCLGTKEKDINLQIAQKIEQRLKSRGINTHLTRNSDKNIGLYERVEFTNKNNSDIFISIHNNALPDQLAKMDVSGVTVYYYYPQAKKLSQNLADSIANSANIQNNGTKAQSFAVIRNPEAISVLVEVAYLITPEDNANLINENFQNKVADAIMKGLENYINDIQK